MAFNQGIQTKYILSPWCMLLHPAKVLLKVFSILFKVYWVCCGWTWLNFRITQFVKIVSPDIIFVRLSIKKLGRFARIISVPFQNHYKEKTSLNRKGSVLKEISSKSCPCFWMPPWGNHGSLVLLVNHNIWRTIKLDFVSKDNALLISSWLVFRPWPFSK